MTFICFAEFFVRAKSPQISRYRPRFKPSYGEKGAASVDDINGQSAFAIWDKSKRQLFLSRDRMGVYTKEGEDFVFASERIRLRADVPIGTYVSGGIDSTLITSLVHQSAKRALARISVRFTLFDETQVSDRYIGLAN